MTSFVRIALAGAGVFTKIEILADDDITDLAKRACAEFPSWKADSSQLPLYLVAAGGDEEPSEEAISAVLSNGGRLGVGWSLTRAGVSSGAWLVARKVADVGAFSARTNPRLPAPPGQPVPLNAPIFAPTLGATLSSGGGGDIGVAALAETMLRIEEQRRVREDKQLALLSDVFSALRMAPTPTSPAQLAHVTLEAMRASGSIIVAATTEGAPALTVDQQSALRGVGARDSEVGVVKFLTPVLSRLCIAVDAGGGGGGGVSDPCQPALVNSERVPWLVSPAAASRPDLRLKPDLFFSWLPFVALRGGTGGQGGAEDGYFFGALGGPALQQERCAPALLEAKRGRLRDSDFGELVAYHRCVPGRCHGLLFGPEEFWAYESMHGLPVRLVKDAWAAGGSEGRLRAFFAAASAEPPLVALLRRLLRDLGAVPRHVKGRCYLGSGAFGHVFTVALPGDDAPRALKAVLRTDPTPFSAEFSRMRDLAERGAPIVAPVQGSLHIYLDEAGEGGGEGGAYSGGYLMQRVGAPIAAGELRSLTAAFGALRALHLFGAVHGDARLPNLLDMGGGELAWIDLRTAAPAPSVEGLLLLMRHDAHTLARSALGLAGHAPLPAAVAAALAGWGEAGCAAEEAARAVWDARGVGAAAGAAAF
jgi:hypothetical protein